MRNLWNTYVCEHCHKRFVDDTPEGEAEEEMRALWGDLPHEQRAIVCHDCWLEYMEWWRSR